MTLEEFKVLHGFSDDDMYNIKGHCIFYGGKVTKIWQAKDTLGEKDAQENKGTQHLNKPALT